MLVHDQDADSLRRFLGTEQDPEPKIPERIEREYFLRLRMFHADGNSGPLGTLGLIDLLRFCGFTPEFAAPKPEPTNWDAVKRGTRIEAQFGGAWHDGEFMGFGDHKVLVVKLDNDPIIRESRRDFVRIKDDQSVPVVALAPESIPETPPEYVEAGWQAPAIDWAATEPGAEVWAEINDDPCEGKFVSFSATEGNVTIEVNGEQHVVPTSQVTLASPVSA